MWAGLLLRAACVALLLPGTPARGYTGRKTPGHFGAERRRLGPHVCLSGFGSGCCPGWAPSMGSGHCTLPLCSFGCGSGICIAPNVCSCQDGEQGPTCPEAHGPCGEYGCDLTCNHGGCQEVARVCPVGFSMTETAIGIRCTDIDECLSSSCEGHCVNTEGGFVCECGPGMQLSADRHSCQDTDECLGTPCQQRCKNSIGSYRCSCRTGFHLHGNRHSCVDVNECRRPLERRVCHHSCHNTVGSFLCTCQPGFRLRADRVSCEGCFHSGVIRAEGDVFSPPNQNCTVCVCLAGNVSCISPECPPGPCQASPKSDCCTCVPVRCYFHGRWYADGAVFSGGGDECTTCVCQNGEVECSFTPCPELDCPREEWWLGPGQCCFTCREPAPMTGCSLDDNGVEFPVGQIWSPGDPCELCICQADGSVSCKRTDCVDSCPHPIRIPGQCCPDCSAGCTYTGRIFYNNQTFASVLDPCLSCICLLGSVACSPVDCPITCSYPFHPDGECCPVCRDCNYEGRKVGNGQVFTLDDEPCTQCICQLGEVSCEKMPCQQACSDPSTPPRDCCFSCPDSLEESRGLSPRGDVEFSKVARTPRGDPEALLNCSSCPGPPAVSPQRPVLQLLQLLLRTNLSNMQTIPEPPLYLRPLPGLPGHLLLLQSPHPQPPGPTPHPDSLLCLPPSGVEPQPFPRWAPAPQRPPSLSSGLADCLQPPPDSLQPLQPQPALAPRSPPWGPHRRRSPQCKQASVSGPCPGDARQRRLCQRPWELAGRLWGPVRLLTPSGPLAGMQNPQGPM
ncbi:von Willebrand factor C and EGF domain-containing protein isoform X6 [Balaenoptera acutorostrata]|uniref:von Willebrand factor C and EGF domain-containing protein isoform X6 n=1 Tax=Balaenoptera acutorostrata TaxID=9767 RepID=A0ABM3U6G8_BALAC|nr:von Willebrand factor C and EGF domain-containing protein isoform X6 [Balaenoptera acutorostrata]